MRTAISPRLATRTLPKVVGFTGSHPEDAVGRRGHRRVRGDREPHTEDAARVDRVDHAVVPQPRGGVVGRALALVLVADRRRERLLLGGRPRAAAPPPPVPAPPR